MTNATARPWKQGRNFDPVTIGGHKHMAWEVLSEDGIGVCVVILPYEDRTPEVIEERITTLNLILKSVNAHDALVEALEEVAEALNVWGEYRGPLGRQIQAALKLAKEGE